MLLRELLSVRQCQTPPDMRRFLNRFGMVTAGKLSTSFQQTYSALSNPTVWKTEIIAMCIGKRRIAKNTIVIGLISLS